MLFFLGGGWGEGGGILLIYFGISRAMCQVIGVEEQKDRHIDATHPKNINTYINVKISFMVTPMPSSTANTLEIILF